jgi:hypothetical protein
LLLVACCFNGGLQNDSNDPLKRNESISDHLHQVGR